MIIYDKYYKYYDLFYKDKNYESECDFIENVFNKHSKKPVKTVMDIGCGTGGHALPLVKRGYNLTGIDASATMLEIARQKAKATGAALTLHQMDIRDLHLNQSFDACVCMFAVLDYLTETTDLQKALKNIRGHLKKGSLFLFDFWNGLAVLRLLPEVRVNEYSGRGVRVTRIAQPELDTFNHICKVRYSLLINRAGSPMEEIKETHVIRFFFPQEIRYHLEVCGFKLLQFCPFPNLEGKADENTWSVAAIARATSGGGS